MRYQPRDSGLLAADILSVVWSEFRSFLAANRYSSMVYNPCFLRSAAAAVRRE
jgi:hypothetical protein